MAAGTEKAVTEATRLGEIGFPEFTAKLVTDVFEALVAANLNQTESYLELLQTTAKTLTEFINDTKDDVPPEEVLAFLARILPNTEGGTMVVPDATLKKEEASSLTAALAIDGETQSPIAEGKLDDTAVANIVDAAAKRIAANRYDLLKEMVKLGILRLVVEHGVIETRLVFNTWGSSLSESAKKQYTSSNFRAGAKAKSGFLISQYANIQASSKYNKMSVSSASQMNRDVSGSQVQIYGRVQIDFKTDYQPLTS